MKLRYFSQCNLPITFSSKYLIHFFPEYPQVDHTRVWCIVKVRTAVGWMHKKVNPSKAGVFLEQSQKIDFKQKDYWKTPLEEFTLCQVATSHKLNSLAVILCAL